MLSQVHCLRAARSLCIAHIRYRELALEQVKKDFKILVYHRFSTMPEGSVTPLSDEAWKKYSDCQKKMGLKTGKRPAIGRLVELPSQNSLPEAIDFVFWHEVGHIVLNNILHDVQRTKSEDPQRPYTDEDWPFEWWCDRFAFLMIMYRCGVPLIDRKPDEPEGADLEDLVEFFKLDAEMVERMRQTYSHRPLIKSTAAQISTHIWNHEGMQQLMELLLA